MGKPAKSSSKFKSRGVDIFFFEINRLPWVVLVEEGIPIPPKPIPKVVFPLKLPEADATKLRQGKDVKIEDLNASSGPN